MKEGTKFYQRVAVHIRSITVDIGACCFSKYASKITMQQGMSMYLRVIIFLKIILYQNMECS